MDAHVPARHPSIFRLVGSSRDGDYWLDVSGELDLATDDELRIALATVQPHTEGTIWLGVGDLDFVDAASLHQLLTFVRTARLSGRSVGVDGARGVVRRMAGLMGFEAELAVA
ncbi:STAS domain-containing protein [Nocardioides iriomotensis]|uniref:STAS domain-containing protein n=1 Tax=Nocardioides iriomotensis TaxID=715784 RepID=A0A4Q5J5L9_9ACTN|nr:STAS domain-containing protein [Nocardioides iriomotensis]RYU13019.1 STAS domain-containing protein [Nocardioides iriomotensis]